jgi:HEPN domain-containing protein
MKPPEEVKRELVRQWLSKAEMDLGLAQKLYEEHSNYLEAICFHSHQAVEKYLKAFLVQRQIHFPKTHNLGELLDIIGSIDAGLSDSLREITILNPYAVEIRYPDDYLEITVEDAGYAVKLAVQVQAAIGTALRKLPDKQ